MACIEIKKVTVLYYKSSNTNPKCTLCQKVMMCPVAPTGRIIIKDEFKMNKSIVAVCEGEVNLLADDSKPTIVTPQVRVK